MIRWEYLQITASRRWRAGLAEARMHGVPGRTRRTWTIWARPAGNLSALCPSQASTGAQDDYPHIPFEEAASGEYGVRP